MDSVKTIKGLKAVFLLDEDGYPSAFDIRNQIKSQLENLPIIMNVDFDKFVRALDEQSLPGGVMYNVLNIPDIFSANKCMDKVRNYRV